VNVGMLCVAVYAQAKWQDVNRYAPVSREAVRGDPVYWQDWVELERPFIEARPKVEECWPY
jgi:hypothetical protein